MLDIQDSSLRLFGKVIQLSPKDTKLYSRVDEGVRDYNDDNNDCDYECTSSCDNFKQSENNEKTSTQEPKEIEPPRSKKGSNSTITEDTKPVYNDKECSSQGSHNKVASDQTSSTNPQDQKPLKKPDKILPCPRCNSMTTKFCYYNNYNVNQPRHFCKDCQRYWTAGGTMRNVPVGAGRRKSKSSVGSQHRHFVVPEASKLRTSYKSYGVVQENVNINSFFFGNGVIPQGLSGLPISFCSTENRNLQSRSVIHYSDHSSTTSSRKHSRDGTILFFGVSDSNNKDDIEEKKFENGRVVSPKTLKIDNPLDASNSSIWNTLQIKNNPRIRPPIAKRGFFGGVQKSDENPTGEAGSAMVLEFNPAASSRSLSFHEIAR